MAVQELTMAEVDQVNGGIHSANYDGFLTTVGGSAGLGGGAGTAFGTILSSGVRGAALGGAWGFLGGAAIGGAYWGYHNWW